MDKISVITICFNLHNEIERTLRSAFEQTYQSLEFVIVDGGSKDGTVKVIERIISDYPTLNINFKSERDRGIYDAMNKGLERASGDWVIFMNGGDWFHSPTTIEDFFKHIESDTIIAHGDIIFEDRDYRWRAKPAPLEQMGECMTVKHQATFTRLSYHKEHPFDSSYRSAGDYNFFYKAHFTDSVKFQYIPMIVGHFYGIGGESMSNKWNSHLEYLRVRGLESSIWDILKLRYKSYETSLKVWIKKHCMSRKYARKIEIARIKRIGGTEIETF